MDKKESLMKKVLVLFGILSIAPMAAFAYVNESKTSSVEVLRAQGYSESTLRVMDTVNDLNKGEDVNKKYVRRFQPKKSNAFGRGYTSLKHYWDPAQEDDSFGEHQIEFTNTWQGDSPHYATNTVEVNPGEVRVQRKQAIQQPARKKVKQQQQRQQKPQRNQVPNL